MDMRFPEEQQVLADLLREWYSAIEKFTDECDGVFSEKAKQYDRISPVWHRVSWPDGFVQELRKKIDRLRQLLSAERVNWDEVNEELRDIMNYSRMFGAINRMMEERHEVRSDSSA